MTGAKWILVTLSVVLSLWCVRSQVATPDACILELRAWGHDDFNDMSQIGYIKLNSQSLVTNQGVLDRGLHLVELNPLTCEVLSTQKFSFVSTFNTDVLTYLSNVAIGMVVAGVSADDISSSAGLDAGLIPYGILTTVGELTFRCSYAFVMKKGDTTYSTYHTMQQGIGPFVFERVIRASSSNQWQAFSPSDGNTMLLSPATLEQLLDSAPWRHGSSVSTLPAAADIMKVQFVQSITTPVVADATMRYTINSNGYMFGHSSLHFVILYHGVGTSYEYVGIRTTGSCVYHGSTDSSTVTQTACSLQHVQPGTALAIELVTSGSVGRLVVDGVEKATFTNTFPGVDGWTGLGVPYGLDQVLRVAEEGAVTTTVPTTIAPTPVPAGCVRVAVTGAGNRTSIPGLFIRQGTSMNNKAVYKHESRELYMHYSIPIQCTSGHWRVAGTLTNINEGVLLYAEEDVATPDVVTKTWSTLMDGQWVCIDNFVNVICMDP